MIGTPSNGENTRWVKKWDNIFDKSKVNIDHLKFDFDNHHTRSI